MTLQLHLTLEDRFCCQYRDLGEVVLGERQCNMFYLPRLDGIATFRERRFYRFLDIHASVNVLASLQYHIPLLNPFLEKVRFNKPAYLIRGNVSVHSHLVKIVEDILASSYTDELLRLYGDNSLRGLTMLLLREASLVHPDEHYLPAGMNRMEKVRIILRENLKKYPGTHIIARELGINATKLREDFTQTFNITPRDYWYQQRMEKTGSLLKDGKGIKRDCSGSRV